MTLVALYLPGMRAVEGRHAKDADGWTAYYDRVADVVHVRASRGSPQRSVARTWGSIDVDAHGRPVAARYLAASERMPTSFLARLAGEPLPEAP